MNCNRCGLIGADTYKYCPGCGLQANSIVTEVDRYLANCVKAELGILLKDQKVVEVEIAEAVATRLSNWGKLVGYYVGACIAMFVLALGVVGIKTMSDLQGVGESVKIEVAKKFETEITKKYQEAAKIVSDELEAKFREVNDKQMDEVRNKGASLLAEFEQTKTQLAEFKESLTGRVDSIEKKVDRFNLQTSEAVSIATRSQLENALANYQRHLISLGYMPGQRTIEIAVTIRPDVPYPGMLAYYDLEKHAIVVNSVAAKGMDLTDLVLREYGHHVLLSFNKYDDAIDAYQMAKVEAVESGMVTFFVCSFRNNPVYGGPLSSSSYSEDLTKQRKISSIRPGVQWSAIDGSPAWGSLFWAIRVELGQDTTERILFESWKQWKLDSNVSITDFANSILSYVKKRRDDDAELRMRNIMANWGVVVK